MESFPRNSREPYSVERAMIKISKLIGKDVKTLGRALGIRESEMENIEVNEGRHGNEEVAYKIMLAWKRFQNENATVENLAKVLARMERGDIAKEISGESFQTKITTKFNAGLPGGDRQFTLKELQATLRQKYKLLRMKGLPWMEGLNLSLDKHFVSLEMVNEGCVETEQNGRKLEIEQIFETGKQVWTRVFGTRKTYKIFVEGNAGFGKTTLATKLCYDYGNGKAYMNHFDLVLLYSLRNFTGNLEEMICNAAFVSKHQQDRVLEIISRKSVQTLLILDGFDELPKEHVGPILSLIRGEIFSHVSLVLTSRPGRFTTIAESSDIELTNTSSDIYFDVKLAWNYQYRITGLSKGRQREFVEKHLKNYSATEKARIEKEITEMKDKNILSLDLLQCPLFFLMIFMILAEVTEDGLPKFRTMTDFYKGLMNFVVRRYLAKEGFPDASKADLFAYDNAHRPFYVNIITQLGQVSLASLNHENIVFSKKDILALDPRILKLGIISQTVEQEGLQEVVCYEPFHKTVIEFLASYYLLADFRFGHRDEWKETIRNHRPTKYSFEASLLLPFLAGLMEKEAGALFNALAPCLGEYLLFDRLIPTLPELELSVSVLSSLVPFLPTVWNTYWFPSGISSSSFSAEIMQEGLRKGKIKTVFWDLEYAVCFTDDMKVEELELRLRHKMSPFSKSKYKGIECKDLTCTFTHPNGNCWKDLLPFLLSIHYRNISFVLLSSSSTKTFLPLIHDSVVDGKLRHAEIHKITCWLQDEGKTLLDMLNDLIQRNRVEVLEIGLNFRPTRLQLENLVKILAKSSRLTRFEINCIQEACPLTVQLVQFYAGSKSCRIYNTTTHKIMYST